MNRRRVTQADVAATAGVHQATVSLALKNHRSIPQATRDRIHEIAKELGYTRDPMLTALAAYRDRSHQAAFHGTLAWLTNSSFGFDWRTSPHYTVYLQGVIHGARQHGYEVEEFDVNAPGMSTTRTASILRARNISGILLCPLPRPYSEMQFPWDSFSAVTFGYSLAKPRLHTVAPSYYQYMQQTIQEVRNRGYQNIGMVLEASDDQRFDHIVLASYLVSEYLAHGSPSVPPLLADYRAHPEGLRAWVAEHQPDVIVCHDWRILEALHRVGIHPPENIGLACAGIPSGNTALSGVLEDSYRMGEVAVDLVVAMIQRGERGIPDKPQRVLVEGDWSHGTTLPTLAAAQ